jgi:hypothetical protein
MAPGHTALLTPIAEPFASTTALGLQNRCYFFREADQVLFIFGGDPLTQLMMESVD